MREKTFRDQLALRVTAWVREASTLRLGSSRIISGITYNKLVAQEPHFNVRPHRGESDSLTQLCLIKGDELNPGNSNGAAMLKKLGAEARP